MLGSVRAVEVTHGRSGWHPHTHALLVLDRPLSQAEVVELWAPSITRWQDMAERVTGRRPDSMACFDVRRVDDPRAVSDYVVDVNGWTIGAEVTAGPAKFGRVGGRRSPLAMLGAAAMWGDADAARLWAKFDQATAGRKAIVMSRDLFTWFPVEQLDDEEAAKGDEEAAKGDEATDVIGEVRVDAMVWSALAAVDAADTFVMAVEAWAVADATGPPPDPVDHVRAAVVARQAYSRGVTPV